MWIYYFIKLDGTIVFQFLSTELKKPKITNIITIPIITIKI